MKNRHLNEGVVVNKALEIIERTEGLSSFNMRSLARELGCAHTNIYNYFDSFNSLLWTVAAYAMRRMSEYIFVENTLEDFMRRYVDFAFEHSGLYRLIWFYKIDSDMPLYLQDYFSYPSEKSAEIFRQEMGSSGDTDNESIQMSLAYAHGEIAMALNKRVEISDLKAWKKRVLCNALYILKNSKGK